MAFVPDPPQNSGPRILPKVFSDVPSANELANAKAEVAAARSSRNMLLLVVVLLLGMLIAAGAALVYFESQTRELPDRIEDLIEDNKALQEELDASVAEYKTLEEQYKEDMSEYSELDRLIKKNDEIRAEIETELEKEERAVNVLKDRRGRGPTLGAKDDTSAYTQKSWLQLRDQSKQSLIDESKELEEILEKVKDYRPPRGPIGVPL